MQYVYLRYKRPRGSCIICAGGIEYERIEIDADLLRKMRGLNWSDYSSWEGTGLDIDEYATFCNIYPLDSRPCFAVVTLLSEEGYEDRQIILNGEAEILTKHGDVLERIL